MSACGEARGRADRQRGGGAARGARHDRRFRFSLPEDAHKPGKIEGVRPPAAGHDPAPYYPASDLFRVVRDDDGLQVDFMGAIHGIRSFEGVRDRAAVVEISGVPLLVASLDDVIRSRRAAGRPRDLAVIEILEKSRDEADRASGASRRPRERKR
jgi:hypothetical protein